MGEDQYEVGPVVTVGGPTGTYIIHSPYNTECEWALYLVSANGAGMAMVSAANNTLQQATVTAPTLGLFSSGMDGNAFEGIAVLLQPALSIPMERHWQPLGRGANVFLMQTLASGNGYITVAFRRLASKILPSLSKGKPHTHTPLSGHKQRTFAANFQEAQYQPGAAIDVIPDEDTATSARHLPPGKNPMAALDRKMKRNG